MSATQEQSSAGLAHVSGGWTFTYLYGSTYQNTYEVVSTARNGVCNAFLSCTACYADTVDLYGIVCPLQASILHL